MAKKNDRLGTGLAAIFGDNVTDVLEEIQSNSQNNEYGRKATLKIGEIRSNPYQPRKVFDDDKLQELANSIKLQGVFTPILVRKSLDGYELVAGERRLRASQLAGKEEIPAIIVDFNEEQMMEISLLENIQREDLNVIEQANAYQQLINKFNYTQEQLATRVSKSREHVTNSLRLLKLPKDVQQLVQDHKLSMGHVRPLITLEKDRISEIAKKAVDEGLSVRQVEALVSKKPSAVVQPKVMDPYLVDVQHQLQHKFGSKVKITDSAITISYANNDDLNRLLEILGCIEK